MNEKYTGDALLQKTYCENHLTKKKIRNHGELTQYYAENTHPAIIDRETFERVQLERAARWASENVQNPTYARYLFSGRVVCGNCGAHYNRRTQTNGRGTPRRITWQCVTYSTKGKRACPAKQIPERTLMELTCEALGIDELTEEALNRTEPLSVFDESVFTGTVDCVIVRKGLRKNDRQMVFRFKDGTEISMTI